MAHQKYWHIHLPKITKRKVWRAIKHRTGKTSLTLLLTMLSLKVRFTKLLTNGFRSSFEISDVCYELSNFVTQLSIKSRTLKRSCKFHAELRVKVAKFVVTELRAIQCSEMVWYIQNKLLQVNPISVQEKAIPSPVRDSFVKIYSKCTKPTNYTKWCELLSQRTSQLSHEVQREIYNFVSKFAI